MSQTITLTGGDFKKLLGSAVPFAAKKGGNAPILESILIRTRDGEVQATATDRYRIGVARVPATDATPGASFLLHVDDAKTALRTAGKAVYVWVTIDGDKITVRGHNDVSFYRSDEPEAFPRLDYVFRDVFEREQSDEPFALNSTYLADFGKVGATDGRNTPIVVHSTSPKKPTVVTVGDHFFGLIMPLKRDDDATLDAWRYLHPASPAATAAA